MLEMFIREARAAVTLEFYAFLTRYVQMSALTHRPEQQSRVQVGYRCICSEI
jgi:hypothetical protein